MSNTVLAEQLAPGDRLASGFTVQEIERVTPTLDWLIVTVQSDTTRKKARLMWRIDTPCLLG